MVLLRNFPESMCMCGSVYVACVKCVRVLWTARENKFDSMVNQKKKNNNVKYFVNLKWRLGSVKFKNFQLFNFFLFCFYCSTAFASHLYLQLCTAAFRKIDHKKKLIKYLLYSFYIYTFQFDVVVVVAAAGWFFTFSLLFHIWFTPVFLMVRFQFFFSYKINISIL